MATIGFDDSPKRTSGVEEVNYSNNQTGGRPPGAGPPRPEPGDFGKTPAVAVETSDRWESPRR